MNCFARPLSATAVVLSFVLFPASPAFAALSCSVTQMTATTNTNAVDPEVQINDRGDMVWTQRFGGIADIIYYDAGSGETFKFTDTPSVFEFRPRLNNRGDVAWWSGHHPNRVMLYDAATAITRELTAPASCRNSGGLSLNNVGQVAWSSDPCSGSQNGEIFLFTPDALGGTIEQLTNNQVAEHLNAINDHGDILFTMAPPDRSEWEIQLRDGATRSILPLTNNAFEDFGGDINNNGQIVWTGFDGTDNEIFLYDVSSGQIINLTENGTFEDSPAINDAGDVVYSTGAGGSREIVLFDAATENRIQLSDDSGSDLSPSINNLSEVIWVGATGNGGGPASVRQVWMYSPTRPLADAGPDRSAGLGDPVTLDGSASCDPNSEQIEFSWTMTNSPPGSQAVLSDPESSSPGFVVDFPGEYMLRLRVTDPAGAVSVPDEVTVSGTNVAPVADAGPDRVLNLVGTQVTLDGSQSSDADDDPISYQWTLALAPSGSSAALSDPTAVAPTFIADVNGLYIVTLVVTDVFGAASAVDRVRVSFDNVPPVANAGDNQAAVVGETVVLDGSGSSDANLEPVFYQWSLSSIPEGSIAWLSMPDSVSPAFFADLPGTYIVTLIAKDRQTSSQPDSVTVEVVSRVDGLNESLISAIDVVNTLDPDDFRKRKEQRKLTRKIGKVMNRIEKGRYDRALRILDRKLIPRVDGCALAGEPDKKDWIQSCEAQGQVYPLLLDSARILGEILDPPEPPPPPPPPPPPGGGGL